MWCHYCDKNNHNTAHYRAIAKFKQQKKNKTCFEAKARSERKSFANLSIFFTLERKGMGEGGDFSRIEGTKAVENSENLPMAIFWIEILQQKCDHIALC
jgi:hypothetical protein